MYTIYMCDRQPYGECPCPWKNCNDCVPETFCEENETEEEP